MNEITAKPIFTNFYYSSEAADSPLDKPLRDRDIGALEKLYKDFLGDVRNFFDFYAIDRFIKTLGNDPKKDLEVLDWLYEKGIGKTNSCFVATVLSFVCSKAGENGVPLIKWCLSKKEITQSFFTVERNLQELSPKNVITIGCFLDSGVAISEQSLTALFRNAVFDGNLATMNLIWEKCKDRHPEIHLNFLKTVFNPNIVEELKPTVFLDWVYDALLSFHGTTYAFPRDAKLQFNLGDQKIEESLFSEIEKRGMGWERLREKSRWSDSEYLILKTDFTATFQTMGPEGLSFFEWVCKEKPETLSSYTFDWAFLKSAINGEVGLPLLKSLCESRGKKISYWCFKQAIHLAQKNKHLETAEWLEYEMKHYYPDGATAVSDSDIQLLLASSHTPSGYRPLGDAPKRYGWQPLTVEELVKMEAKDPIEQKEEVEEVTPSDDQKGEPEPFQKLYSLIIRGKTAIRVTGKEEYKEKVYGLLQELLKYPSGRWTLLFISRLPYAIEIHENSAFASSAHYDRTTRSIAYKISNPRHVWTKNEKGVKELIPQGAETGILHEFLHALHHYEQSELTKKIQAIPSSDYSYTHLEEQRTIAGIDADFDLEAFSICENTYRYESGQPSRYGHMGFSY
jgi:hypothetical protein